MTGLHHHDRAESLANEILDWLSEKNIDAFTFEDEKELDRMLNALLDADPQAREVDVEQSLANFHKKHQKVLLQKKHAVPIRPRPIFGRSILAASIALLLVMFSIGQALGIDIIGVAARWTTDTFQFVSPDIPYAQINTYPLAVGERRRYVSLQDAVDAFGITEPLMPTWVPDRFALSEVYAERQSIGVFIYAVYTSDDGNLRFRFNEAHGQNVWAIQSDGVVQETIVCKNIVHYIVTDKKMMKVTWENGTMECSISGAISKEEAEQIICSIYKAEEDT